MSFVAEADSASGCAPTDNLRTALEHMGSDPIAAAAYSDQLLTIVNNILKSPAASHLRQALTALNMFFSIQRSVFLTC